MVENSKNFFDEDILKSIENISFFKEKLIMARDVNHRLRNVISNLRNENQDIRESEKNHRDASTSSKKLIEEQQFTISKLMSVKDEVNLYKEEIVKKEKEILDMKEEKINYINMKENYIAKIKQDQLKEIEDIKKEYDEKVEKMKNTMDSSASKNFYDVKELNEQILRVKAEKDEQVNVIVLEYEEQLQRAHAQAIRLRDELRTITERNNANVTVYLKRIAELEEKQNMRTNVVAPTHYRRSQDKVDEENINYNYEDNNKMSYNTVTAMQKNNNFTARNNAIDRGIKITDKYPTPPKPGAFKIANKNAVTQRFYKPLNVQIRETDNKNNMADESDKTVSKGHKRKLFNRHNDEFFEEQLSD